MKEKSFLYNALFCWFLSIGLGASLSLYFDFNKQYGLILAIFIIPALIIFFIKAMKYLFDKNK